MSKKNNNTDQFSDENIANNKFEYIKTNDLEDGQSIEGTVLGFRASAKFPDAAPAIVMQLLNGQKKNVNPSGNLKYAIRDGLLEIGKTYRIRREGSKKVKGMTSGNFGIYPAKTNTAAAASTTNNNDNEI